MQELVSTKRGSYSYPLQTIKVSDFVKMTKVDKATQIKIRLDELEKELDRKHMKGLINIELGEDPTSEKNVRYINRMIRTIRGDEPTATGIVVEIFEMIVGLRGESKKIHWEIYESLDKEVPVSSIRRILSLYRNGKLG
jgi:hypothetical protein